MEQPIPKYIYLEACRLDKRAGLGTVLVGWQNDISSISPNVDSLDTPKVTCRPAYDSLLEVFDTLWYFACFPVRAMEVVNIMINSELTFCN